MNPEPIDRDDEIDRDGIIAMLGDGMADLHTRILVADPQTPDQEALHLKRVRTLGYLANQYRKLQKDRDIDEMEAQLELLTGEEAVDGTHE